MFDFWDKELTDDEETKLLDKAANEIKRRKLTVPAILLFEMHKPISYIGSQAAIVFSPFLVPFLGFDTINDYSRLLAKRHSVEALIQRLEQEPESTMESKEEAEG